MAEGPAVAAAEATYGGQVRFVGIGGLTLGGGADLGSFVEQTGTGGFTQLDDQSGDLYARFGAEDRSTFLFVNQDGSFVRTSYGRMTAERLDEELAALIER